MKHAWCWFHGTSNLAVLEKAYLGRGKNAPEQGSL